MSNTGLHSTTSIHRRIPSISSASCRVAILEFRTNSLGYSMQCGYSYGLDGVLPYNALSTSCWLLSAGKVSCKPWNKREEPKYLTDCGSWSDSPSPPHRNELSTHSGERQSLFRSQNRVETTIYHAKYRLPHTASR